MIIKNFQRLLFTSLFIFSLTLGDEVTFKIGNVKYDYNNLEFTYTGSEGIATFNVGKFSFSTMNSGFEFNDLNENARLDVGPSKLILQNLDLNFLDNYSQNNIKFDLGTLKFDITKIHVVQKNMITASLNESLLLYFFDELLFRIVSIPSNHDDKASF